MLSKISIGVAPNKTACIKVEEKKSEDVRDDLVQMMREELEHRSNTFQVCQMSQTPNGETTYLLLPVKDELKYMLSRCMVISGGINSVCEQVEKIDRFFKWMEINFMNTDTSNSTDSIPDLDANKISEHEIVRLFKEMCEQSIDPKQFEELEDIISTLNKNRSSLRE